MTSVIETSTPEDIAESITIGMRLVYDLFNEMDSFFRLVAEGLRNSGLGIRPHSVSGTRLPRTKDGRTFANRFLSTDMGLVAEIGPTEGDDEELDEDDEDLGDDEELTENEEKSDKKMVKIAPDSQYLMLRAILFDARVATKAFRPEVVACKLSTITRRRSGKKAKGEGKSALEADFEIKRAALKRFAKRLGPELKAKTSLICKIPRWELSGEVTRVEHLPLAEVDSEEKVSGFVGRLLKIVEE